MFTQGDSNLVSLRSTGAPAQTLQLQGQGVSVTGKPPTTLALAMDQLWALIPTDDDGYHIRSSRGGGEYLAVDKCEAVVARKGTPHVWDMGFASNQAVIQARGCGEGAYLTLQQGTVALAKAGESWQVETIAFQK